MSVHYHPDKANVMADALGQLYMRSVVHVDDDKKELVCDDHRLTRLGVRLIDSNKDGVIVHNGSELSFVWNVRAKQDLDSGLVALKKSIFEKVIEAFSYGRDGVLRFQGRLCVLNVYELRNQ
ncbi:hypothetical protein MTR67_007205 [Solanum verrucosum]|uniref:Uncharacterized protein n=1 Tax=Solanum verrucosum TaxID=315347 RepID=A0AAF0Q1L9_SOLVR|nr:hypothetical protein MTR67_007205 [Solanum verrucosum]